MSLRLRRFAPLVSVALFFWVPAQAQEMVQTFRDPAFGGNPFNSDFLKATAEYNRPAQTANTPSADDLLASQIRSQLTSTLSSDILTRIQTAVPGDSGSFTLGTQEISYSRSLTETVVTFTNTTTGAVSKVVIPVIKPRSTSSAFAVANSPATGVASAEQTLGAVGSDLVVSTPRVAVSGASGLEVSLGPPPL